MFHRVSSVVPSLSFALVAVSLAACAADAETTPAADEAIIESGESELRADSIVGLWTNGAAAVGEFVSLDLRADGGYEAAIAACPSDGSIGCLALPRTETGRFRVLGSGDRRTLRLAPTGATVRRFAFTPAPSVEGVRAIELVRSGKSQVLSRAIADEGEPCGEVRCQNGSVCCNALASLCAAPNEFCIQ